MSEYYIHPDRKTPRIKPFKAFTHMRQLLADKEDTEQVFHIIEALNGNHLNSLFEAFITSEKGAQRFKERRYLPDMLDDHSWINALPEGSLGRAYVKFMKREGLTANGLVEESEKFNGEHYSFDDDLKWFSQRLRDTHDMFHVLSGYGRDALGEASLLGFTHGQEGGRGILFIAFMATRQIAKHVPKEAKVWDAFKEGRRNGEAALPLVQQDFIALMKEPLEDVRKQLNINPPIAYKHALRVVSDSEIDYTAVGAAA